MDSLRTGGVALPRPLGAAAVVVACLLLTAFFVYRGFPYDRLAERLATSLSQPDGAHVSLETLRPRLSLAGPGFEAAGVRVTTPDGMELRFDRLALRPAWSTSWLRLEPAIHVRAEGPTGQAVGVITAGGAPAWNGTFQELDLSRLPVAQAWPGTSLRGTLDASVDLRLAAEGPEGSVELEAHSGRVSLAALPTPVDFEQLTGALAFGGDALMRIETLHLKGPIFSGDASGSIGRAATFEAAPLDLSFHITADSGLRPALRAAGLHLNRDGTADLRVTGTPAAPVLR